MKRLIVLLAVLLLAGPALATVTISIVPEGCKAAINYATTGEKVRGFALDITVDKGTIKAISDYMKGESTAAAKGYGIFPANFGRFITVDPTTGEVANWNVAEYTPVADVNDPGALGGIGTNGVTIEMGSLYYPTNDSSPNAPPNSGTLCKLEVSEACKMSIALNAARGGIVLTDPAVAATVAALPTGVTVCGVTDCFPSSNPKYNEWVAMGKPNCWCYARQCHGDADGKSQGAAKTGIYYVGTNDLNILVAAWQVKEPPVGPGIASVANGICADFARDQQGAAKTGLMRVYTNDLNILIANWLVKEPALGPGVPGDCGGTLVP